jgi:hypothetical protein
VQPFSTLLLKDIVKNLLGGVDGKGPLQIEVLTDGTEPPSVISRTYAARNFGNLGSGLPADVEHATGEFTMPGLLHDANYRSSVAVMAGPDKDVSALFQLYRGLDGGVTGLEKRVIKAGELGQWSVDEIFPGQMREGHDDREGHSFAARYRIRHPRGQRLDRLRGVSRQEDSDFVDHTGGGSRPRPGRHIVELNSHLVEFEYLGDGNQPRVPTREYRQLNTSVTEISLEYLPENTDNSSGGIYGTPFLLGGHDTFCLDDVLRTRFGITNGKGVLLVKATKPITVTSRVWTAGPGGGTSGNGVRTVPSSALADGEVVLPGVRMLDGFRTNVGVVTGDAWATVEFRLRDADGLLLAQKFLEVPPRTLTQLSINKVFGNKMIKTDPVGSLVVTSGTEFLAYLTVIDGTSQDPLFMMSR